MWQINKVSVWLFNSYQGLNDRAATEWKWVVLGILISEYVAISTIEYATENRPTHDYDVNICVNVLRVKIT